MFSQPSKSNLSASQPSMALGYVIHSPCRLPSCSLLVRLRTTGPTSHVPAKVSEDSRANKIFPGRKAGSLVQYLNLHYFNFPSACEPSASLNWLKTG
ncbi:hypothetical protein SCLCIDRAFT_1219108 [Scleroderma citrinum Foug A]|uniref:Uncharacterized protein n=1 Tax=Scleroderma citrinum Foug A TaxID=1036808 RepID=A0A0C3DNL6_9AGAM|nr:hypothetical protein SCLCIDRAFT_1219108 [Scleroderma citrinum Foug A]